MEFARSKCCFIYNKILEGTTPSRISSCSGFSLIEVLVSMLVLAIGVIGAAGMQLAATRTTRQSALQTVALQLASEMSDKIRANDLSTKGTAENPFLSVDYNSAMQGEPTVPDKLCFGFDCNDSDVATFDIYEWERRIGSELPGGRARICRDARPWDQGRRSLTWECTSGGKGAAPLVIKLGWQSKNPDGSLIRDGDAEFPPFVALTVTSYSD